MSITRERLEARREELKQQLETLKQQYNAVVGAIADVEFWLTEDAPQTEPSDAS